MHPEPRAHDMASAFVDAQSGAQFQFAPPETQYPRAEPGERVLWMRCSRFRVPVAREPLFLFAVPGGDHEGFVDGAWCIPRVVHRPLRSATGFIIAGQISADKPVNC